jgi:hypothetical protein
MKHAIAGATLAQFLRVTPSSGKMVAADASTAEFGTLETPSFEDGDEVTVATRSAPGTRTMVASEAIALYGDVFAAANGKVAASGSVKIGTACTVATADNDQIEVARD